MMLSPGQRLEWGHLRASLTVPVAPSPDNVLDVPPVPRIVKHTHRRIITTDSAMARDVPDVGAARFTHRQRPSGTGASAGPAPCGIEPADPSSSTTPKIEGISTASSNGVASASASTASANLTGDTLAQAPRMPPAPPRVGQTDPVAQLPRLPNRDVMQSPRIESRTPPRALGLMRSPPSSAPVQAALAGAHGDDGADRQRVNGSGATGSEANSSQSHRRERNQPSSSLTSFRRIQSADAVRDHNSETLHSPAPGAPRTTRTPPSTGPAPTAQAPPRLQNRHLGLSGGPSGPGCVQWDAPQPQSNKQGVGGSLAAPDDNQRRLRKITEENYFGHMPSPEKPSPLPEAQVRR